MQIVRSILQIQLVESMFVQAIGFPGNSYTFRMTFSAQSKGIGCVQQHRDTERQQCNLKLIRYTYHVFDIR